MADDKKSIPDAGKVDEPPKPGKVEPVKAGSPVQDQPAPAKAEAPVTEAEPRHRPTADHVVTRPPSKIASQNKDKTLCPEGKCEIFDNSSPTAWLFYRRCSMLCC